jgi:DNA polymerase-1
MKLAMLAAYDLVQTKYADSAKLLLQIHDELIAEVDAVRAEAFASDLKRVMEGVYQLSVPLAVSVEIGNNWGEI